jgi:hypothetical protein
MTRLASVPFMAVLLCSCRLDMHDQPRYKPLQPSRLFPDGRSSRPLPEGTVARGHLRTDRLLFTGRSDRAGVPNQTTAPVPQLAATKSGTAEATSFDPGQATEFPFPVTRQLVERGRDRYEIFCTPCHAYNGHGRGMIVQRGLSPAPSFHSDRLRGAPVGHFFDVITNGYGAMYSYASRVGVNDRWAIIAYIRALQLSHNSRIDEVPPQDRAALGPPTQPGEAGAGQLQPNGPPATEQRPRSGRPEGAR